MSYYVGDGYDEARRSYLFDIAIEVDSQIRIIEAAIYLTKRIGGTRRATGELRSELRERLKLREQLWYVRGEFLPPGTIRHYYTAMLHP